MTDLDAFIENLQEQIDNEARQAYGEKGFERWRNPRFQGRMEKPDAVARVTGSCGDTMEMYLRFEGDRVAEASYFTDGCASSSICGSFAAELAIGMDPDTLADIDGDAVLRKIGRLPEQELHCADLAAAALQEALSSYMKRHTKPFHFPRGSATHHRTPGFSQERE
ncbi:MAG: iron-sulfur cluster assembly scaffold protein [Desulfobacteraceae bacterium]|jgi:nitrogen fixation NifU-like protein|nr:iron-sulfur cluster assembly scaffold protein [Desulfobacteraceae bacterium]